MTFILQAKSQKFVPVEFTYILQIKNHMQKRFNGWNSKSSALVLLFITLPFSA